MNDVLEIIGSEDSDLLLIADHASNKIASHFDQLGLDDKWLEHHIAYDIGTADLCRALQEKFNARAVLARFSRLIVDPNRPPEHEALIPQISDNVFIPGNANLSEEDHQNRIDQFHSAYHEALGREIADMKARGRRPVLVSIHSFTPIMNGEMRPWHAAVLWNKYSVLAHQVADTLETRGDLVVGRNVPYSGKILNYTMDRHAETQNIPYVTLEIRQDLISDKAGVDKWTHILSEVLLPIV